MSRGLKSACILELVFFCCFWNSLTTLTWVSLLERHVEDNQGAFVMACQPMSWERGHPLSPRTAEPQLTTVIRVSPGGSSRRTTRLSSAQRTNPQNHELIRDCCLKPLRFGITCYAAGTNWYTKQVNGTSLVSVDIILLQEGETRGEACVSVF